MFPAKLYFALHCSLCSDDNWMQPCCWGNHGDSNIVIPTLKVFHFNSRISNTIISESVSGILKTHVCNFVLLLICFVFVPLWICSCKECIIMSRKRMVTAVIWDCLLSDPLKPHWITFEQIAQHCSCLVVFKPTVSTDTGSTLNSCCDIKQDPLASRSNLLPAVFSRVTKGIRQIKEDYFCLYFFQCLWKYISH